MCVVCEFKESIECVFVCVRAGPHRYQTLYQVGVLVSRSSLRCVKIRNLWALALLQVCGSMDKKTQNAPQNTKRVLLSESSTRSRGRGNAAFIFVVNRNTESNRRLTAQLKGTMV